MNRLVFTGDHRSTVSYMYDTSPKASRRSLRRLGCVPALIASCCARTVPPPLAASPLLHRFPRRFTLRLDPLRRTANLVHPSRPIPLWSPLPPPTAPYRITQAFRNKRSKGQPMHSSRMLRYLVREN